MYVYPTTTIIINKQTNKQIHVHVYTKIQQKQHSWDIQRQYRDGLYIMVSFT